MDPLSALSYFDSIDRRKKEEQQSLDQRVASGILSKLDSFKDDPARYDAFKKTYVESNPEVMGSLSRIFGEKTVPGLLDSSLLTDERQIKTDLIKNTNIAQSITQKLNEMRDDPVRYKAFTETFIRGKPEIQRALVAQYGVEGVEALLSTAGMKDQETKLREQKLAEGRAATNPEVFQLVARQKKNEQDLANALALEPTNVAAQAKIAENKAVQEMEAKDASQNTTSYFNIVKRERDIRARTVLKDDFESLYNTMLPDVMDALGRDEGSPSGGPDTLLAQFLSNNKQASRQSGSKTVVEELMGNYKNAILWDSNTTFEAPDFGGLMPSDGGKISESQYKAKEEQAYRTLARGYYLKNGKPVKLDPATADKIMQSLIVSPVMNGNPSPYFMAAQPFVYAMGKEESKLSPNAKQNLAVARSVFDAFQGRNRMEERKAKVVK